MSAEEIYRYYGENPAYLTGGSNLNSTWVMFTDMFTGGHDLDISSEESDEDGKIVDENKDTDDDFDISNFIGGSGYRLSDISDEILYQCPDDNVL